jgi:soluble lytic murein transglycosylase
MFYGQIAATELSLSGESLSAAPPKLTPEDFAKFRAHELVRAARLFHAAGMKSEASSFIKAFVEAEETPKAYLYGAELASDLERYYDAISIAKKAGTKGMFLTVQAYPVINDKIKDTRLEKALVHSLIRQESMFDTDARSPAGALGLMQLLPTTAQETARKIGINHSTEWLTSKPDHNIRLGSAFLARLLDKYDGAYPLAIAAYNAGPGRIDKWLEIFGDPRTGQIDIIDWIELIPIYETRNYVQRVVEGTYVYRMRLKHMQNNPPQTLSMATPSNLRRM